MKCALILALVSASAITVQSHVCDSDKIREFNYFLEEILVKLIPAEDGVKFNCNYVKALNRGFYSVGGHKILEGPYHRIGLHKAVKVFAVDIIDDVRRIKAVEEAHNRTSVGFGCLLDEDDQITCLFRSGSYLSSRELLEVQEP